MEQKHGYEHSKLRFKACSNLVRILFSKKRLMMVKKREKGLRIAQKLDCLGLLLKLLSKLVIAREVNRLKL